MTKLWQHLLMQQQSSAPPAAAGYRYWRMLILNANGASFTGLEEVEFRLAAGGPTITTPSTPTLESSKSYPYMGGEKTVDQATVYTNITRWVASGNTNEWVSFDLLEPVSPVQFAFQCAQDASSRAPKNYIVQASNDGLTGPWTDIKSVTGAPKTLVWQVISLLP